MLGKQYDMAKLDASGKFDTTMAMWLHYDSQSYFDELTDFVNNYKDDMSKYTPAFVVHSDDDRNLFLSDCYQIRAMLMRLGMIALMNDLAVMEDASRVGDVKGFSDGQVKWVAMLKLCKTLIEESAKKWKMDRPRKTKS